MTYEFDVVIGLEIHAQLNTKTKLWCSCIIDSFAEENSRVCNVCLGTPGALPVLNQAAVEKAIMAAQALNCQINYLSGFDRKNYFYPDLPKGYQITQYTTPVAQSGFILIDTDEGAKKVKIERVQIEEDTGKSTHEGGHSLINFNRCGTPLIEIVGAPELSSAHEAGQYYRKIHILLSYIDVTHGNMQEGNLRCDANVSIKKKGEKTLGIRTEIKNLNSFRNLEKAIEVEVERQKKIILSGGRVEKETLGFDAAAVEIKRLRKKSDENDYRYFPEPDLLPLSLNKNWCEQLKNKLPELPDTKKKRFQDEYELNDYDASQLIVTRKLADYFEETLKFYNGKAKNVANWILVEFMRLLNESGTEIDQSPVSAKNLAELLNFVADETISGKMAKDVFEQMYDSRASAGDLIEKLGLKQISDDSSILLVIEKVMQKNTTQLQEYRAGKEKLFGFFVGQVMKEMKGQGNPEKINQLLKEKLRG